MPMVLIVSILHLLLLLLLVLVLLLLVDVLTLSLFAASASLELLETLDDASIGVTSLFILHCGYSLLLSHHVVIVVML